MNNDAVLQLSAELWAIVNSNQTFNEGIILKLQDSTYILVHSYKWKRLETKIQWRAKSLTLIVKHNEICGYNSSFAAY
jgi:hypothetical protein